MHFSSPCDPFLHLPRAPLCLASRDQTCAVSGVTASGLASHLDSVSSWARMGSRNRPAPRYFASFLTCLAARRHGSGLALPPAQTPSPLSAITGRSFRRPALRFFACFLARFAAQHRGSRLALPPGRVRPDQLFNWTSPSSTPGRFRHRLGPPFPYLPLHASRSSASRRCTCGAAPGKCCL